MLSLKLLIPCAYALFIQPFVDATAYPPAYGVSTNAADADGQTFDYIVIGGGLTGLTVASRLTENSDISVLVVEAGADNRTDQLVYDIYNASNFYGSTLDWSWKTDQGRTMDGFVSCVLHVF